MSFRLFVALRCLFSRRKQTFIYIISLMSILGVAIGVGALVVVLGVYNGLTTDMRDRSWAPTPTPLSCPMCLRLLSTTRT